MMTPEQTESTLRALAGLVASLQVDVNALHLALLRSKRLDEAEIEKARGEVLAHQTAVVQDATSSTVQTKEDLLRTLVNLLRKE
jgi:hypothetical protein